jgi:hypothetical protein
MEPVTLTPINPNLNIWYCPKNKKNKWRVFIKRNKKIAFSSFYETEEEAVRARDAVLYTLEAERLCQPDLSRPTIKYNQ